MSDGEGWDVFDGMIACGAEVFGELGVGLDNGVFGCYFWLCLKFWAAVLVMAGEFWAVI